MAVRILMVCLGNICRSPLAEAILRDKTNQKKIFVDSAGTGGFHIGHGPDERSIAVAAKHGLDISNQRCRKLVSSDLDTFDRIYAMDRNNYNNIKDLAVNEQQKNKVHLLLNDVDLGTAEVPDPYYGGRGDFERVYDLIDKACEAIAQNLDSEN